MILLRCIIKCMECNNSRTPAVYQQEDGTYKNYTYTVKEVGSQEEYITEYTKDENGYNYVITNTHTSTLVEGDSVVIDFGLPVKVNVLANDAIQGFWNFNWRFKRSSG